jgi:hypothetical protein
MPYHIGSFDQAVVDAMPPSGKIVAIQNNPNNNNKCVAYEDTDFNNFGVDKAKTQQVFPLAATVYWTVMPYSNEGACLYCSFPTLSDLLNNAQFTPDLAGGAIGGGTFGTIDDIAIYLSNIGGMLIIPTGIPYVGP